MSSRFLRDTPFGYLVRLCSGRKVFRYPDEVNSELWTKSAQMHESSIRDPALQNDVDNSEKSGAVNKRLDNSSQKGPEAQLRPGTRHTLVRKSAPENDSSLHLVDWYCSDDHENPHHWSSSHKLLIAFQICFLNFAFYTASSIYVPGEASIMQEFHSSETVATLGLSLSTVGYGLGPMLWSPLSDVPSIGRNPIHFLTFLGFVLLQIPTAHATNMPMFLIFRFLTGFLGSPALATAGATLADMYDPAHIAYGICIWGSSGIVGPVMGPINGGFVATAKNWRWTIWVVMWMCVVGLATIFFLLPETNAGNILYRRAKRLRRTTGRTDLKSQSELDASPQNTGRSQLVVLGRAFILIFTEPIVLLLDIYVALLYGVLFIWFESFPLVFGDIYHFTVPQQGLVFLGIFAGGLVSVPLFLLYIKYHVVPLYSIASKFKPESLLPPTFVGSAALPICLFWFAWSSRASVPWIVPIIGSAWFTVAIVTLFNPVLNYLGTVYADQAASVYAGNALFRAGFGAGFHLFARQLFRKLGVGPGNSLLGGIAVCFLPLPYIFYKYGEKIRGMSRNARHDL